MAIAGQGGGVTIMVDEIRKHPGARRLFHNGACHLTVDGELNDLHTFARKIGMRRSWFQDHPRAPHYDLTPARRDHALGIGAVFVPAKTQARRRLGIEEP